jgi:hypothetical protein
MARVWHKTFHHYIAIQRYSDGVMYPEGGNYRCHDNQRINVSPYTEKDTERMSQQ